MVNIYFDIIISGHLYFLLDLLGVIFLIENSNDEEAGWMTLITDRPDIYTSGLT